MSVRASLRFAVASDMGRRRTNNEDRYYADPDLGIFAVIDGVGGHAAGEHAAETAVEVLRERLERQTGSPEERLREAIALANNEIYRQGKSRADWNGMACVLTVALIEDDIVTVGHVGDSRLYLLRPGEIRKITHDHSPVGEREDRGEIGEAEAMRHSRRNEIFRDVGSVEREPNDPGFIEITSFPMPYDGAVLICSDGLSDLVSSSGIRAGMERYAPDYEHAIQALIEAANDAGGKDNITIAVVASPGYNPEPPHEPAKAKSSWPVFPLLAGLLIGLCCGLLVPIVRSQFRGGAPRTLIVSAAGINAALTQARSGDTVLIPQGKYKEEIHLREGVTLRGQQPSGVILISPEGGPVVTAQNLTSGSLEDVWIQGDLQSPAFAGLDIADSTLTVANVRITGALTGVEIRGASAPLITSNQIANNLGAGIDIIAGAKPKIENNLIAANGNGKPGEARPGVDVHNPARPVLKDNGIVDNAADPIWIHGETFPLADYAENFFGKLPAVSAIKVIPGAKP